MQRGSVIVDISIDQGGCSETSRPTTHADPTYVVHDVVHYCVTNMPGAVARTSTFALNNATLPFILALGRQGPAARDDWRIRTCSTASTSTRAASRIPPSRQPCGLPQPMPHQLLRTIVNGKVSRPAVWCRRCRSWRVPGSAVSAPRLCLHAAEEADLAGRDRCDAGICDANRSCGCRSPRAPRACCASPARTRRPARSRCPPRQEGDVVDVEDGVADQVGGECVSSIFSGAIGMPPAVKLHESRRSSRGVRRKIGTIR